MRTKIVSVKLDARMMAKVSRVAKKRGVSRSTVIRDAIESIEDAPLNALAAFGDAVGSLAGPADLSTNPAYLDGLGE
jgi:hypothetical protein